MGKPFSEMTPLERRVNRNRLQSGMAADFSEAQMEEKIRSEITRAMTAWNDALRRVGAAMPTLGMDSATSAADVYRAGLEAAGVDCTGLATDASLEAAWGMFTSGQLKPRISNYGADADSFNERFPNVARVRKA